MSGPNNQIPVTLTVVGLVLVIVSVVLPLVTGHSKWGLVVAFIGCMIGVVLIGMAIGLQKGKS